MVNFGRNEVSEFYYASSLNTIGQAIVPAYGTSVAAVGKYKRVRITDLKVSCAGTACDIVIGGTNSSKKAMTLRVNANSTGNFDFNVPYPIDCTSGTGAVNMIYGSSSDVGVKVVVTGYYDVNE